MKIGLSVPAAAAGLIGAMFLASGALASVGDLAQYKRYEPNPNQCRYAWVKVPTGATAPHKPKFVYRYRRVCFLLPKPRRINIKRHRIHGAVAVPRQRDGHGVLSACAARQATAAPEGVPGV